ncbi:hypothetical protein D3C87_460320 [compost metagenome]
MHNLINTPTIPKASCYQIQDMIKELEKNIEYLKIFQGQELARSMMQNLITSLKALQTQINAENLNKQIPFTPSPVVPNWPPFGPIKTPLERIRETYPDNTGGPAYFSDKYTITSLTNAEPKVDYK